MPRAFQVSPGMTRARRAWHYEMFLKSDEAARRFWIPHNADPPKPAGR